MNDITPPFVLAIPFIAIQLGWYVAVIVLLYKIWQKVKHLPG
jgi:hypothetical protein